VFYRKNPYSL